MNRGSSERFPSMESPPRAVLVRAERAYATPPPALTFSNGISPEIRPEELWPGDHHPGIARCLANRRRGWLRSRLGFRSLSFDRRRWHIASRLRRLDLAGGDC